MKKFKLNLFLSIFIFAFTLQSVNIFADDIKFSNFPVIAGGAGAVMDFDSGAVLWSKDGDSQRTIASMTKVLAIAVAFDEIKAGNLNMDDKVVISANAAAISNNPMWSGHESFKAGEIQTVRDLLNNAIVFSGNASIVAIGEHISGSTAEFATKMNALAEKIGMNGYFVDPAGMSENNTTTAKSMLKLGKYIYENYENEIKSMTMLSSVYVHGILKKSTNMLLNNGYYGIEGLKTGTYSSYNANFIGVAKRGDKRLIAVTINTPTANRFSDITSMFEFGWKNDFNQYWKNDSRLTETQISSDKKNPLNGDKFKITLMNKKLKNINNFTGKVRWFINGEPYLANSIRDMNYSNLGQIEVSKNDDEPMIITAQLWFGNEMYDSYSMIFQDGINETQNDMVETVTDNVDLYENPIK